jgi:formate hydrogenlyase subunit 3/multisubunit Na+/H+ antiporter MnhD subunit
LTVELFAAAAIACILAFALSAWLRLDRVRRGLLVLGGLLALAAVLSATPSGTAPVFTPFGLGGAIFQLGGDGLWLLGFGLVPAILACGLGHPQKRGRLWTAGAAASLLGAVGVFGFRDALVFLIAWELMSLGGALMILGDRAAEDVGRPTLFMLALLEVGAVALVGALLLLSVQAGTTAFDAFPAAARAMPRPEQWLVGVLFLIGFGAKLGLLPFYEWFPGAYGSASGASGALMSGVVLNAAFFALGRALIQWAPVDAVAPVSPLGAVVVVVAVPSAILAAFYAFQQEDWRCLLSLSSAENASISVCLLGVSLMFRQDKLPDLAGLAWTVALLHLAGHALAKGGLFLCADGCRRAEGDYRLTQRGVLRQNGWVFGLGALFAAMSLAAMPPQAGFVSEWFTFQTLFQGFHLTNLGGRLIAALAGAGLALTAAIALATFVKAFGLGLLGREEAGHVLVPPANRAVVGALGLGVLILAVGMPWWLQALRPTVVAAFGYDAAGHMRDGLLLVPLTAKFAFISPSKLIIALPLLAILPVLLIVGKLRHARVEPVWYGGRNEDRDQAATTALAFSNALRTFYSFIYRPTERTTREQRVETNGHPYFVRRLSFDHDVAPIFGPYLFAPLERLVLKAADKIKVIQSGRLNLYLLLIGLLLVIILFIGLGTGRG